MDRLVNINDVSHHVSGSVLQAGVVYGDVHVHQARPAGAASASRATASSAQVRALLPASRRSAVVVNSRRRLSGLVAHGGRQVPLDALSPDAAVELLRRVVGGDRVATEPEPARDVAVLCVGMPIALHVVAARLVVRPHWRVSRMAAELAGERRRLRALAADDGDLSVEACFDLSYRGLPPAAARLYRLLGAVPGAPASGYGAAAALTGSSEADAEELLGVLVEAIMVADTAHVRYCLHDLVGLHARRSAERQELELERTRAVRSVVSWFLDRVVMPLRRHLGNRTPAPVGSTRVPRHWTGSRKNCRTWWRACTPRSGHGWNE